MIATTPPPHHPTTPPPHLPISPSPHLPTPHLPISQSRNLAQISLEEFENNMPEPLRETLDEALKGGWTFDEEKWQASQERHKVDPEFDSALAYGPMRPDGTF